MSFANVVMRRVVNRLIIVQVVLTLIVALVYLAFQNTNGFLAALFGGSITLSGTLLMAWRISRAGEAALPGQMSDGKYQGYVEIYIGAIQKFVLTLVLMAFGMGYLKLDPLAILIGFAVTQLSYIANKVDTRHETN
ncbi:ATP synthase subunit I [sulfur-oxidizing endosymbiont of Gigantopelta aegis]|uniref:ATP synthase subunit I n=1 Tax=sulfur-oxidizing endosymbiont of Gigantopelta aegis TaxID=2794934 RepID=UPI0018DBFCC7|nr:ATP synthase subunit I [sulfur-oxidizing endosymbiont of Gigantopelta aegis]